MGYEVPHGDEDTSPTAKKRKGQESLEKDIAIDSRNSKLVRGGNAVAPPPKKKEKKRGGWSWSDRRLLVENDENDGSNFRSEDGTETRGSVSTGAATVQKNNMTPALLKTQNGAKSGDGAFRILEQEFQAILSQFDLILEPPKDLSSFEVEMAVLAGKSIFCGLGGKRKNINWNFVLRNASPKLEEFMKDRRDSNRHKWDDNKLYYLVRVKFIASFHKFREKVLIALQEKSQDSSISSSIAINIKKRHQEGDKVWACWMEDGQYFPGTVKAYKVVQTGGKYGNCLSYHIQFDDEDEDNDIPEAYVMSEDDYHFTLRHEVGRLCINKRVTHHHDRAGDVYAKLIGWYKTVYTGERIFSSLKEAVNIHDKEVVKRLGAQTKSDDLILNEKWVFQVPLGSAPPVLDQVYQVGGEGDKKGSHLDSFNIDLDGGVSDSDSLPSLACFERRSSTETDRAVEKIIQQRRNDRLVTMMKQQHEKYKSELESYAKRRAEKMNVMKKKWNEIMEETRLAEIDCLEHRQNIDYIFARMEQIEKKIERDTWERRP